MLVYVPPEASVKVSIFNVATAGVVVLPVKFNDLNQLLVVSVAIAAPLVIDRLGAL